MCERIALDSPALYETKEVTVTYEAHRKLTAIQAKLKFVERELVLIEAHCPGDTMVSQSMTLVLEEAHPILRVHPAKFKRTDKDSGTRRFSVEVPASVQYVSIPPHPSQVSVKTRADEGAMHCLEEDIVPAETKKIRRRVVDTPPYVSSDWVPERTETITERVIFEPAHVSIRQEPCDDQ